MEAVIFALAIFFHPANHRDAPAGESYQVPLAYSVAAWDAAQEYDNVEPEDVLTILIGEHGWRHPYDPAAVEYARRVTYVEVPGGYQQVVEERPANVGLFQISRYYVRAYNDAHGTDHTLDTVLDWRLNMDVAVYNIHRAKSVCIAGRRKECANGNHYWTAHWTCGSGIRDEPRCQSRKRLHEHISTWRESRWGSLMAAWKRLRRAATSAS